MLMDLNLPTNALLSNHHLVTAEMTLPCRAAANTLTSKYLQTGSQISNFDYRFPFKMTDKRQCCTDKVFTTSKHCCSDGDLLLKDEC